MRVLVIDELSTSAESYLSFLDGLGYETRLCADGADALEFVQRWRPHVVMLNIDMTDFDGFEFIERIRQDPELRPRLSIACTGYECELGRTEMAGGDFDHLLPEPISWTYLHSIVQGCDMKMMDSFIQPIAVGHSRPH